MSTDNLDNTTSTIRSCCIAACRAASLKAWEFGGDFIIEDVVALC